MANLTYRNREIILRESNLYAGGEIYVFADGTAELSRQEIDYKPTSRDRYRVVRDEDTLLQIAYQHYKDHVPQAHHWWHIIARANDIENPLDLSPYVGESIIIPDIMQWKINYL